MPLTPTQTQALTDAIQAEGKKEKRCTDMANNRSLSPELRSIQAQQAAVHREKAEALADLLRRS